MEEDKILEERKEKFAALFKKDKYLMDGGHDVMNFNE